MNMENHAHQRMFSRWGGWLLSVAMLRVLFEALPTTAANKLVDVNASGLTSGPITSVPNTGTLGGAFMPYGGTFPSAASVTDSDGLSKNAIQFNGSAGGFLQLMNGGTQINATAAIVGSSSASAKYTHVAWLYLPSPNDETADPDQNKNTYLSWAPYSNGACWSYGISWNSTYADHWTAGPSLGWPGGNAGQPAAGKWHFFACVCDGTSEKLYLDGSSTPYINVGGTWNYSNGAANYPIRLGCLGWWDGADPDRYFRGAMAMLQIYDDALSVEEINNLYGGIQPLSISGKVTNTGDVAIEGATVHYKLSANPNWSTTTTDASGDYSFPAYPLSGPWDIYVSMDGYLTSTNYVPSPSVGATDPVTGINFKLADAVVVSGTVTRYGIGKPGTTVYCYAGAGRTGTLRGTATTDVFGHFIFNLPSAGTNYVSASAPGYSDSADVEVEAPATGVNINLTATARVRYAFDETSGETAADSSGHGSDGSLTGTSTWTPGYITNAWSDAGAGSVTIPNLGASSEFTFATWVKVSSLPPGPGWNVGSFVHHDGWYTGTPHWFVRETGEIQGAINSAWDFSSKGFTFAEHLNTWVHLALVYDKDVGGQLYINGTLNNSWSFSGKPAAVMNALRIGSWNGNERFINARFDDFRIYAAALPQSEIQTVYDWGVTNANLLFDILSSAGTGGTISPSGVTSVSQGDSQAYTITPGFGYVITDVVVDSVSQGATGTYTFSNVQATHTIAASFAPAPAYAISGQVTDSGSGAPLANATVYVSTSPNASVSATYTTTTDGRGCYSISLFNATWYLCASHPTQLTSADIPVAVTGAPLPGNDFALVANGRNIPAKDKLLFSVLSESLPTVQDGDPGNWPVLHPLTTPVHTLAKMGSPTIDITPDPHEAWARNHPNGDGFRFANYPEGTQIPVSGGTIVVMVWPGASIEGDAYQCLVSVFLSQFAINVDRNTLAVSLGRKGGAAWEFIGTGVTLSTNAPAILSYVVQPTGEMVLYKDGEPVYENSSQTAFTSLTPPVWFGTDISVGKGWNGDGWSSFNGLIGDVFVYKTALNQTERVQLENDLRAKYFPPKGMVIRIY